MSTSPKEIPAVSLANLIPITKETARELGARGGRVKSPAKRLAATLRSLERSKKISPESKQFLLEMMTSDELSSFHILRFLSNTFGKSQTLKDEREAERLLLEWKKMHHGTKETQHKIESVNVNIDVNIEDWERRLRE